MRTEIWRTPIVNGEPYENYQVSNFGKILSLNYGRTGKSKLKRLNKTKTGYLQVQLSKNKKKKTSFMFIVLLQKPFYQIQRENPKLTIRLKVRKEKL